MASQTTTTAMMIDGFNLGLPRGTGVATYARNLSRAGHDLGRSIDILYGLAGAARHGSPLLREVSFFEGENADSAWTKQLRTLSRLRPRPFGLAPFQVPVSGDVITRPLAARLPYFDRVLNIPDVYGIADYQFAITGRRLMIRNPGGVGIMHWTYPLPLRLAGARNVYTLHDLVPLRLPFTTLDHKPTYLRLMKLIVAHADRIVTVSETSRADIIRLLDCPPEKVVNTYQSVDIPRPLLDKSDDEVRAEVEGALGLPYKGYFLFFGAIEPKKNVGRLIQAYLASTVEAPLAIIGPTGWQADQELRLLNELTSRERLGPAAQDGGSPAPGRRIVRFEFVPFSLLVSAIRGARATVFPSLYEGFGLPILESMLLGTPVITSRIGATAETAGDCALLVDPYDTGDIAAAVRRLDGDPALRADLATRGRARAAFFSPERYQERLRAAYDGLI
ncbi:MAG: glycosyltransferase family 1 protein [Ancalomicrobiaceae bacterium]|nr:glycosyltransferase family 1 protein [Ancalomicrobiaceae bacterium]